MFTGDYNCLGEVNILVITPLLPRIQGWIGIIYNIIMHLAIIIICLNLCIPCLPLRNMHASPPWTVMWLLILSHAWLGSRIWCHRVIGWWSFWHLFHENWSDNSRVTHVRIFSLKNAIQTYYGDKINVYEFLWQFWHHVMWSLIFNTCVSNHIEDSANLP